MLAMFLMINHCAIPSLVLIPPLEPWHSWGAFLGIIKPCSLSCCSVCAWKLSTGGGVRDFGYEQSAHHHFGIPASGKTINLVYAIISSLLRPS